LIDRSMERQGDGNTDGDRDRETQREIDMCDRAGQWSSDAEKCAKEENFSWEIADFQCVFRLFQPGDEAKMTDLAEMGDLVKLLFFWFLGVPAELGNCIEKWGFCKENFRVS
jgi:hypothetical protein